MLFAKSSAITGRASGGGLKIASGGSSVHCCSERIEHLGATTATPYPSKSIRSSFRSRCSPTDNQGAGRRSS